MLQHSLCAAIRQIPLQQSPKGASLFWNVWKLNKYYLHSAIRNSRPPSWDLSSNLSFFPSPLSRIPALQPDKTTHENLQEEDGKLSNRKYSQTCPIFSFLTEVVSSTGNYTSPGLSVLSQSLPFPFKVQLNCFIIIRICALFSLVACTDGKDWVLTIFTVSPPTAPHSTCKGVFSLQMLNI